MLSFIFSLSGAAEDMKRHSLLWKCVSVKEKKKPIPGGTVRLYLSVPLCPLSTDTYAYSTHGSVSLEWFVHQFVGSALFAAGNLHHHFNQQGSASSPKHSATIGKPRGQQYAAAQAAASCRPGPTA